MSLSEQTSGDQTITAPAGFRVSLVGLIAQMIRRGAVGARVHHDAQSEMVSVVLDNASIPVDGIEGTVDYDRLREERLLRGAHHD